MADLVSHPSYEQAPISPGSGPGKGGLESIEPLVIGIGIALMAVVRWIEHTAQDADERHLRAERLAAYRLRRRWKASDVRPLLTIGISEPAQRRLAGVQGKGRPVVKPHRPLEDVLCDRLTSWSGLLRDDATPDERRRSFRAWPWRKHHIEALNRGESDRARANGTNAPHDHAERIVADALRMSQGLLHMICGEIRAQRHEDPASANFPPMLLAEYEAWMEHGEFPRSLDGGKF